MRSFAAFLACSVLAFAAEGATFVRMQAQPGDPTASGAQIIEHSDTKAFSFTVKPNSAGGVDFVRVVACNPICYPTPDFTEIRFAPAAGQAFGVGTYAQAQIYSPSPGPQPGLLADEAGRDVEACKTITGSFKVVELQRAGDGSVLRFAADFEQHCRGQAPALFGGVRFNSDVPYVQPAPYAAAAVRYTSEAGDAIALGTSGAFEVGDGQTSSVDSLMPPQVRLQLKGPDGITRWDVTFATGNAAPLAVGIYSNAATSITPAQQPIVRVTGEGRTCASYAQAEFQVHEIVWSAAGLLQRFAADLRVRCKDATGFFDAGVRYNSIIPYTPPAANVATGNVPEGGVMSIAIGPAGSSCVFGGIDFLHASAGNFTIPAPQLVGFPYAAISFRAENCTSAQIFDVEFPVDLPPTSEWWVYGPTAGNLSPHWYRIPSGVSGRHISFTIADGGAGDSDIDVNGVYRSIGMLVVPGGTMQDLWWSGFEENGWGLSLIQHRDILFGNLFVYDANGAPIWYVMPSGSWDATHTVYTGEVYLPQGSPYYAYDVSRFNIGSSVGTMRLAFSDWNHAAFDYTISGVSAHKDLTRITFGPVVPPLDAMLGDLWWGGTSQNGWGIPLLQQFTSLFSIWFTYDAAGKPTWFVMPQGDWVFPNDYRGKIYKPVGPPWLGVPYDPSRHRTLEAGTFRYRFSGDTAIFDYTLEGHAGSIPLSRLPF
jgi:hypothetical protein